MTRTRIDARRLRLAALAAAGTLLVTGTATATAAVAASAAGPAASPMSGSTPWPGMPGGVPGGIPSGTPGGMPGHWSGGGATCAAPTPSGRLVRYVGMDMGGSMMGRSMMRLMPMWSRVRAGKVTLDLVNRGTRPHELLVYRLSARQVAGQRHVGSNDRVAETGVLGEVEPVCSQPKSVDGIAAGNVGRVTLTLKPGRYEIVCNLPGHYRNGMYATLVVV